MLVTNIMWPQLNIDGVIVNDVGMNSLVHWQLRVISLAIILAFYEHAIARECGVW